MSCPTYDKFEMASSVRVVVDVMAGGVSVYHCAVHLSRTTNGKVMLALANCTELECVAVRCTKAGGEGSFQLLKAGWPNELPLDFGALKVNDQTPLREIRRAVEAAFTFSVG